MQHCNLPEPHHENVLSFFSNVVLDFVHGINSFTNEQMSSANVFRCFRFNLLHCVRHSIECQQR